MIKLAAIAILVLIVIYWNGERQALAKSGLDCTNHIVYAVCKGDQSKFSQPSFIEILKAGVKFR